MKNTSKPKLMTKILIFGGLRGTELLKIRRGDISLVDGLENVTKSKSKALKGQFFKIYVRGKGNKERIVYINAIHIKKDYDNYIKDSEECVEGLLFCTEGNKKYSINALYQQCNRLLSRIGMTEQGQKGSQTLSHSYMSYLAVKNVDLADISTLLGHASQEVTELYIHISKEGLRDVVKTWKDI
jgi:site-specific recombinase XerD